MSPLAAASAVLALLAAPITALAVTGGEPVAGNTPPDYDRGAFGRWLDADGDCQDARNEVLARDLDDVVLSANSCLVLSGTLVDPYTGEVVHFQRGRATSREVQVDHVLPLREAWYAGAWKWTDDERREFSSDLDNLVATSASSNGSKGAQLPVEWVDDITTGLRCEYVQTVALVVAQYDLDYDDPLEDERWYRDGCRTPLT